jgi:hypothetical protein
MTQKLPRSVALAVVLAGGCRGETAVPGDPPANPAPSHQEARVTATPTKPQPSGPALAAEAVVPHFQAWWKTWSSEHLVGHPLKARLDERVAAGGTAKEEACDVLAAHVEERAPAGSQELLYGDPAALRRAGERCWSVHHDGMMGPGLGGALANDGAVLAVWVVLEG